MRASILFVTCVLHLVTGAPQFVTFKDGKIGVNFGGYHAEAGLGGLLTGNAAHGGLSASAGTPWGPKAAAGLDGSVDGRSTGIAYAGAEANPSVGASAVLSGNAGERGYAGAEAHRNLRTISKSISLESNPMLEHHINNPVTSAPERTLNPIDQERSVDAIQKIKPHKKYHLIKNEGTLASISNLDQTQSTTGRTFDTNDISSTNYVNNSIVMINAHRQRLRKHRRQQQHVSAENERILSQRSEDNRIRNRQRYYRRQLLPSSTDINEGNSYDPMLKNTETNKKYSKQQEAGTYVSPHHSKQFRKSLIDAKTSEIPSNMGSDGNNNQGSGVLFNALNIPIGILRVIQESLTGIGHEKQFSATYEKN